LGGCAAPRTHWEFEAAVMLLGGHWPPRGLLSGRWPPCGDSGEGGGEGGSPEGCSGRRRRGGEGGGARKPGEHCFVVHCNSVRQVARVIEMREPGGRAGAGGAPASPLPRAVAAAAALLQAPPGGAAGLAPEGPGERAAPGVATVRFRFVHRPEWLQAGARVILRGRSDGHVAAAGCITALLL
jgi:hypothetical protein